MTKKAWMALPFVACMPQCSPSHVVQVFTIHLSCSLHRFLFLPLSLPLSPLFLKHFFLFRHSFPSIHFLAILPFSLSLPFSFFVLLLLSPFPSTGPRRLEGPAPHGLRLDLGEVAGRERQSTTVRPSTHSHHRQGGR